MPYDTGRFVTALPKTLCVDLDGTLVRTDTLIELVLAALKGRPTDLAAALGTLAASGKAAFKAALAGRVTLDVSRLPYNEELLDYLRAQRAAGRRLVLATASNRAVAEAVARHLGLFDAVVASDDTDNLRGEAKARRLAELYGEGFAYAGNDGTDLAVWKVAGAAVVVGGDAGLRSRIACPVEASLPAPGVGLKGVVRAMRLHQWVKNLLLFVPLATSSAIFELHNLPLALIAFLCFGLVASGVYLFNDLLDLEADRGHATKRNRPFAAGTLPLALGLLGAPTLLAAGTLGGFALAPAFGFWLLVYIAVSSAYTAYLKTMPLLDAFTLSGLYMLRVVAGGAVTGHPASVWLLNFSGFLFLSLAFLKRYVEMARAADASAQLDRRGYYAHEQPLILGLGLASAFSACIVLGLYVNSSAAEVIYQAPTAIWGLVPLVLFWECRIWQQALRGKVDDDPILYAAKDRVSWLIIGFAGLCYAIAAFGG